MGSKKEEFNKLVNQHSAMLYRYAFWLSKSPEIAQDLVQETFLRAWRGFDSLKNQASAKHWLITILRRENARRFERKTLKRVNKEVDTIESPYGHINSSIEAFALRQAIDEVSPEYREPLILQVLCGYSSKEIAEILDLTPEAVMTRLYRARKSLRKILSGSESGRRES